MAIIDLAMDGTVAVISMNNGANKHHLEFAQTMNEMLEKVIADESVTAMVMTSTDDKNWSQGIDLEWMMGLLGSNDLEPVREFLIMMDKVFLQLLTYPVPAIAAINGHCFANAAIMASAFDFRFMRSDRGFYCVPEVDINIQFAPAMSSMLYHKFSKPVAFNMMMTGQRLTAPEAEKVNVIMKACKDADETFATAMEFARSMTKLRSTYGPMKTQINQPVIDDIENLNGPYWKNMKGL